MHVLVCVESESMCERKYHQRRFGVCACATAGLSVAWHPHAVVHLNGCASEHLRVAMLWTLWSPLAR